MGAEENCNEQQQTQYQQPERNLWKPSLQSRLQNGKLIKFHNFYMYKLTNKSKFLLQILHAFQNYHPIQIVTVPIRIHVRNYLNQNHKLEHFHLMAVSYQ